MDKKLSSLYRLGGLTGGLSGFLMLASSIWFIFGLSTLSSLPSAEQLELIGKIGVYHGIGVVSTILLVPMLLAGYGLLSSDAGSRSILGACFAIPWLTIELIAHCSQTAPLNLLSELASESTTAAISTSFYALWAEWGEALFMTGAFLCALLAICYGSALHSWGNPVAGYLFFVSVIAFPVGVLLDFGIQLHVLIRGIAFLFFGGILIQAPHEDET
ncbi:hypothetical protein J4G07_03745 [Candidatus Poribacteria bacterium]|nr:hypothetical protein [Candidatus Poribacteria bacterium]